VRPRPLTNNNRLRWPTIQALVNLGLAEWATEPVTKDNWAARITAKGMAHVPGGAFQVVAR